MGGSLISDIREMAGFFSNVFHFCDNLRYCELNNLKPIFKMTGPWYYTNKNENIWNLFFEELNDGIVEGQVTHAKSFNYFTTWDQNFICHKGKVPIWDLYHNPNECYKNRIDVNSTLSKFKPIKYLSDQIYNFENTHFSNKKVFGVHVRSTDYEFYDLTKYLDEIKNNEPFDLLFVASDSFEPIIFFEKHFNNVVHFDTDIRRNNMGEAVLCSKVLSEEQKIKHGHDVLIESFLLSKCDMVFCINSNVAANALYLNPQINFRLIHRSKHGG